MCPKNLNFFATDIVTFSTLISALLFCIFHVHLIIFASLRIVSRIVSAHWERRLFGGNSLELGSLATLRWQEPHRWSAHVKHQCYRCCDSSNSSNSSIISSFQFISSRIYRAICLSTESRDSVYDAYVLFQQLETSGVDDMFHPQPEAISDTWPGSHPARMPGCHVVESDVTMTIWQYDDSIWCIMISNSYLPNVFLTYQYQFDYYSILFISG